MAIEDQILETLKGIESQFEKFNISHDWVLGFTIGIFLASVFANLISFYFLNRQLNQMEKEFRHKTRPILARHVHKKELRNVTNQIDGDTYAISQEKAVFHFINNGSTNAVNIRKEKFVKISDNGFVAPILDPYKPKEISKMADLAPTEYYSVDIEWDRHYYNIAVEGKKCYFGLLIWYDDDEGNHYYYHMEGYFDKTMLMLDHLRTGTIKESP